MQKECLEEVYRLSDRMIETYTLAALVALSIGHNRTNVRKESGQTDRRTADRQTDTRPLSYSFRYKRGQRDVSKAQM